MIRAALCRLPVMTPTQGPAPANRKLLVIEVPPETAATVGSIDALARLQLAARRAGLDLRIAPTGTHLSELIRLVGLEEVLVGRLGISAAEGRGEPEPPEDGGVVEGP